MAWGNACAPAQRIGGCIDERAVAEQVLGDPPPEAGEQSLRASTSRVKAALPSARWSAAGEHHHAATLRGLRVKIHTAPKGCRLQDLASGLALPHLFIFPRAIICAQAMAA